MGKYSDHGHDGGSSNTESTSERMNFGSARKFRTGSKPYESGRDYAGRGRPDNPRKSVTDGGERRLSRPGVPESEETRERHEMPMSGPRRRTY
jgi:hypothetical protein